MEVKLMVVMVVMVCCMPKGCKGLSLCNMNEDGLEACKPSVTQPPVDPPSTDCCNALAGADLKCLCSYKNSSQLPFFGIDPILAASLPAKCHLTPPDNC
ncbi:hypothetical protein RJT34_16073 [Clitoria ternatea]|uniref:Bifunctional inhibitor/plant lipid transfer protein/seed storage helical domain-containing protein n=1 Tax=Clitoria ternatea TaxID=43366 RepID=A0AAN9PBZ2_CLITE